MNQALTGRNKLILIIPAFWAALFDICITIYQQPKEYWTGNLKAGNEGNPIGAIFMANHVSGLFVISFAWLVIILVLGYYLPRRIARVFLLFTLIAHSFGASTRLSNYYGFWWAILFILTNSILFYLTLDIVNKQRKGEREVT